VGQERLGPSHFFIPLVLGPLNSLVWYVPSLRYTRGLGWRMHCGAEVTGSHGTLVAVSAPFMMPLRDSDIPMNVTFTFSNKQPLHTEVTESSTNKQHHLLLGSVQG
jgi:hypothetical protein